MVIVYKTEKKDYQFVYLFDTQTMNTLLKIQDLKDMKYQKSEVISIEAFQCPRIGELVIQKTTKQLQNFFSESLLRFTRLVTCWTNKKLEIIVTNLRLQVPHLA